MTRFDENSLALHLEVALACAPPALVDGLAAGDRKRRNSAATDMAWHLAQRLRCFDIRYDGPSVSDIQPTLFAEASEQSLDGT